MIRNIDQVDNMQMRSRSPLTALLILCLSLSGIGGHAHSMFTAAGSGEIQIHDSEMAGMSHHDGYEMPGSTTSTAGEDESCCPDQASCHCSAIPQFFGASNQTPPLNLVLALRSPKTFDFIFDIVPPPPKPA